jgi:peptide/nickel transport system ATP-binding protein
VSVLLEIEHLQVTLPPRGGHTARHPPEGVAAQSVTVVHDVTLHIAEGEALGLVGASGSGKTMTARAIVRLLPAGAQVRGTIRCRSRPVLQLDREELLRYRASDVATIFQDPRAHINPVRRIGDFLTEALVFAHGAVRSEALAKATRLLGETGIDDPERRLRQYPHELSGGQLQRVMIAAALACEPKLLIADEPTTALDVTTQSEVMALLDELRRSRGLALLFITHDLDLAAAVCERTAVMREGRIVRVGPSAELHKPRATTRPAQAPRTAQAGTTQAQAGTTRMQAGAIQAQAGTTQVLEVSGLSKAFRAGRTDHLAVDDVSFELAAGRSLAIVGESGSGKTTIARMIVGLEHPTGGSIEVAGSARERPARGARERKLRAREAQMVFQDNYTSLDPRRRVADAVGEAVDLHFAPPASERRRRVQELLSSVGLGAKHAEALPRALSGGERQRVAIARALAVQPQLLVLDEAVSSLDAATQAQILELLAQIRARTGTSYLFISHDLTVVRRVSDEVVVMRGGRIVERGATEAILDAPSHPYTQLLLDSVPRPGWKPRRLRQKHGDEPEENGDEPGTHPQ